MSPLEDPFFNQLQGRTNGHPGAVGIDSQQIAGTIPGDNSPDIRVTHLNASMPKAKMVFGITIP